MNFAVIATALLATIVLLVGVLLMVRTQVFAGLAKYVVTPGGIWIAAGIRVFAAVVLWFAAPATRFPELFKVFAAIALIAGVGVLLVGYQRVQKIVDWSLNQSTWVLRIYAVIAMGIGGFILWALFG